MASSYQPNLPGLAPLLFHARVNHYQWFLEYKPNKKTLICLYNSGDTQGRYSPYHHPIDIRALIPAFCIVYTQCFREFGEPVGFART